MWGQSRKPPDDLGYSWGTGGEQGIKPPPAAGQLAAIGFGLLTGSVIALYTVWDAYAVTALALAPLLFGWANQLARVALFAPYAWGRRERSVAVWSGNRREVMLVGLFPPAYRDSPLRSRISREIDDPTRQQCCALPIHPDSRGDFARNRRRAVPLLGGSLPDRVGRGHGGSQQQDDPASR
ncbi:hypothetical protein SAMN04487820_111134 [Actinopolyspora mzabensis]|uniref:Uncharacterized protein n=2 Tax=Actinopolyspora mzabensis TaxID=995066 RepID=A0A1G9E5J3_ACTMZ|nr:hypothetical protein SAMN04487820_111134 [Actinopolyspora mzabensis]